MLPTKRAKPLLVVAMLSLVCGCTHFFKPEDIAYRTPDPSAVLACFNSPGGACGTSCDEVGKSTATGIQLAAIASEARKLEGLDASPTAAADSTPAATLEDKDAGIAIGAIGMTADLLARISSGTASDISTGDLALTQHQVLEAVAAQAFEKLATAKPKVEAGIEETRARKAVASSAKFISAYVKAYFEGGNFWKITVDTATLRKKIKAEVEKTLAGSVSSAEADKLAAGLAALLQNESIGPDKGTGFVARGGKSYQFQQVSVTITPGNPHLVKASKIDSAKVIGDITRVVVEGLMDSVHRLPAISNATGLAPNLEGGLLANTAPCHDQADLHSECNQMVSGAQFQAIESAASKLDGATLALVGTELRGIGWFSLNNEDLATFLETLVAATVRKSAEKIAWCASTCANLRQLCRGRAASQSMVNEVGAAPLLGTKSSEMTISND